MQGFLQVIHSNICRRCVLVDLNSSFTPLSERDRGFESRLKNTGCVLEDVDLHERSTSCVGSGVEK